MDYLARLLLSVEKARFVRTNKLDLLMVLLPMLRSRRVFLVVQVSWQDTVHPSTRRIRAPARQLCCSSRIAVGGIVEFLHLGGVSAAGRVAA
ncbi:MAG: hypothetical protein ACJ72M_23820 [Propionibacteriaceae bacterium]